MRQVLFVLVLCSLLGKDAYCQVPPSVNGKVLFELTSSPYYLDNNHSFDVGDTVEIQAGVTILLAQDIDIWIAGPLRSLGTQAQPVVIEPQSNATFWGFITVDSPGESILQHTRVNEGNLIFSEGPINFNGVDFVNNKPLAWNDAIARFFGAPISISDCTITGSGQGEGFLIHEPPDGALVTGCSFTNIPDATEILVGSHATISNCSYTDCPDDAIDLNNCDSVYVLNNFIIGTHNRALEIGSEVFGSSTNIHLIGNILVDNAEGVNVKEGSSAFMDRNTLFGNDYSITITDNSVSTGPSSLSVVNCILYQNQLGLMSIDSMGLVDINYTLVDEAVSGSGNIVDQPDFVDPLTNDFNLMPGSPCINAGDPNSSLDPDGSVADMGAIPFDLSIGFDDLEVFPNPFFSQSHIRFKLDRPEHVRLAIHSLDGRLKRNLLDEHLIPGIYQEVWDGTMNSETSASGVYLAVLWIGKQKFNRKLFFLGRD